MLSVLGYLVLDSLLRRKQLRLSAASQHSLQRLSESLRLETRSLAEIARTDPVTGALNRKGLADEPTRIVRLGEGQTFPMTLVFIDIDHFRRIATASWADDLRVTCSFGVAEWHRGKDLNEGIRRADEAVYRAKKLGRDRVEVELESRVPKAFDPQPA